MCIPTHCYSTYDIKNTPDVKLASINHNYKINIFVKFIMRTSVIYISTIRLLCWLACPVIFDRNPIYFGPFY